MNSLAIVVGTRPEIIKMAPIIRALKRRNVSSIFVHCGQHYDYNMSQKFIEDLDLAAPDYSYRMKSESQGVQTARIIMHMEHFIKDVSPRAIFVEGDTNGVLATALAAMNETLNNPRKLPKASPYGDGTAAEKIVKIACRELGL